MKRWQNHTSRETLRQLRYYKRGAFCQEVREGADTWRFELTPDGRAFYEREWARYRELYPEVDAPEP
jgi:hypothetical protein